MRIEDGTPQGLYCFWDYRPVGLLLLCFFHRGTKKDSTRGNEKRFRTCFRLRHGNYLRS